MGIDIILFEKASGVQGMVASSLLIQKVIYGNWKR
jgi:hypothetical protein